MCPFSGPGNIASVSPIKPYSNKTSQNNESGDVLCQNITATKMARSIEEYEELQHFEALNALESRKRPEYIISYKQSVTPQDVYLQVYLVPYQKTILNNVTYTYILHRWVINRQRPPAVMR